MRINFFHLSQKMFANSSNQGIWSTYRFTLVQKCLLCNFILSKKMVEHLFSSSNKEKRHTARLPHLDRPWYGLVAKSRSKTIYLGSRFNALF